MDKTTEERIAEIACHLCEENNGVGCTQIYFPDPKHWICKAWLSKANGYTRQPEPPQDKLEVVVQAIATLYPSPVPENNKTRAREWVRVHRKQVDKILSLFPEPVLTYSLRHELDGMKPEYQDKLAHMLNTASAMGEWDASGEGFGELAVINPHTLQIVLREKDAAPLAHDQETLRGGNDG